MQITQQNVADLLVTISDVKENLEILEEAAEAWQSAKEDGTDAETTREAREELEEALGQVDASSLCQMLHGKHRGK